MSRLYCLKLHFPLFLAMIRNSYRELLSFCGVLWRSAGHQAFIAVQYSTTYLSLVLQSPYIFLAFCASCVVSVTQEATLVTQKCSLYPKSPKSLPIYPICLNFLETWLMYSRRLWACRHFSEIVQPNCSSAQPYIFVFFWILELVHESCMKFSKPQGDISLT